jgi:uncharacterized protein
MPERRFATGTRTERRAEGDAPAVPKIVGRAATYGTWTTLYESKYSVVRERFVAGAFKNALKEEQDVRGLFNHDPNVVLGRTRSGTLRLSDGDDGLGYEIDPPDTQTVRDLVLTPMERGDITGSSFAFTVRKGGEKWTEYSAEDGRDVYEREVMDADLYDVSPVTYPAYEESTSGLRTALPAEMRSRVEAREARRSKAPTPLRDAYRRWLDGV